MAAKNPRRLTRRSTSRHAAPAGVDALVSGRVEGHPDGHGFLQPDGGGAGVYLPAAEMRQLLPGDRAKVRVTGSDQRGRPRGAIVEVLERTRQRIVGQLHAQHGVMFLAPSDIRIVQEVLVPPGEAGKARPGQIVTLELIAQPSRHAQPVGRVIEVLGESDDAGIEVEIALRKFDLPHAFSRGATELAAKMPDKVRSQEAAGRRDLRSMPFVTIDGETAKDFDDAVCAAGEGKGYRLWVAIADVGHYVRHGDALDVAARERGTSVYFPRRVIPMLPEKLSNGLCSLNPEVDRLAMVCEMTLTHHGAIARYEFFPAVIRSQARLTYDAVWRDLQKGRAREPLALLYEIFQKLAEQRGARGAIDFETVATRMEFDARGRVQRIRPEVRNDAHRLIEECMLAANVCAGAFLAGREHPTLYRVHDEPAEDRVHALREFLAELGLQLSGGDRPRPMDYAQLLERIRSRPDFALLQTILLRSLKQAVYSPRNLGHFGLAFEAYVHFTSPIRRYPDLVVHRAIRACLEGRRYEGVDWDALGRHCSETERRADEASRDVENWLKCQYMEEHVGGVFAGRITGVTAFGVFVTLDDYFVDGLVHISELGRERFRFEPVHHRLLGERTGTRFRLADRIRVKLVRVDLESRKMDFVPA
ncbi:MAG: ribonuclease R [Betaproteobacteria bacterium RIFCSPLOWO2_02_FULL_66_14]|nr:MAG: ribonuclease R [Betaproteobacteria bacterium RIFCSPLOWO2_02_FULL_66_14]